MQRPMGTNVALVAAALTLACFCAAGSVADAGSVDPLAEALLAVKFGNSGIVNATSQFTTHEIPAVYLEPENVTRSEYSWAVRDSHKYLYQVEESADNCTGQRFNGTDFHGGDIAAQPQPSADECGAACCAKQGCIAWTYTVAPGAFMGCNTNETCCYLKSSIPRKAPRPATTSGTVSTAPTNLVHPPSGMRSAVPVGGIAAGSVELRGDGSLREWTIMNQSPAGAAKFGTYDDAMFAIRTSSASGVSQARPLRTRPPATTDGSAIPAVASLEYQGAYPVGRLNVMDPVLPVEASLFAYSAYKVNDMEASALPGAAFTLVATNPSSSEPLDVSFMFTLPFGMEPDQERHGGTVVSIEPRPSAPACLYACSTDPLCASWTYADGNCSLQSTAPLNAYEYGTTSGIRGSWASENGCITLTRTPPSGLAAGPMHGEMAVCVDANGATTNGTGFGTSDTIEGLWGEFAASGSVSGVSSAAAIGAASVTKTLAPGEVTSLTITLTWYFPERDYMNTTVGNYYTNLWPDARAVTKELLGRRQSIIADIQALHTPFRDMTAPAWLSDALINTLSHIRSAWWTKDGRWRQWEAYDCTNIDSVHNDGERHIPYIMFFPNSTRNKVHAWGGIGQLPNGMINEQLTCGCTSTVNPLDRPCGRVMGDVSSMYIQYLLELYRWSNDTTTLHDMYASAKKAALWQISVSQKYGVPEKLQTTYDIVGLNQYEYATYNSMFHLLAMRAASELAEAMNDTDFKAQVDEAYGTAQRALDTLSWNDTAKFYMAYAGGHEAVMADCLYAQVLGFTVGLGPLVSDATKLSQHLAMELRQNDSPYGLMVMTGRNPYPGPWRDNSIWMMGSPDWATLNLHLGMPVDEALSQPAKSLGNWLHTLNDQWDTSGLVGGIQLPQEGLPYVTSHYGYHMVQWHIPLALSGQSANLPAGNLTFEPKVKVPFSLPVMLPGVVGSLTGVSSTEAAAGAVTFKLALTIGDLTVSHVAVGGAVHPGPVDISAGQSVAWTGVM